MAEAAASPKAPLLALAIGAFGIGTTEFVIMGLLPEVAADLRVGLPAAGLLVSGYALGVAFGGPMLAALLLHVPARATLIGLMGIFVAGNLGCAVAPTYTFLMLARILPAFCHAAFFTYVTHCWFVDGTNSLTVAAFNNAGLEGESPGGRFPDVLTRAIYR